MMLFVDLKIDGKKKNPNKKKKDGEKYRIRSDSELIKTGFLPG